MGATYDPGVQMYDEFADLATFEYVFCLWPRRCYKTDKWLFLETAVRGRRRFREDLNFLNEDRWYKRDEALMMMLKGA